MPPEPRKTVLMLLTNAYDPDPRVRQEALSLLAMGCGVRVLAWDRDLKAPAEERVESVQIERVHVRSSHGRGNSQILFYAQVYLEFLRRGWKTRFDAIHCHDLDTLPVGFLLGKLKRKPIVYDSHESFTEMLEGSVHPALRRAIAAMENALIRRIDLLITVGEKLRRHFAERGAKRSTVIGNWKRSSEFTRTEEERLQIRRSLGIPADDLTVVCITNLLKDRQIEELLRAVDETPGVWAIIGGKGSLESTVRAWAARNPRIKFVGFVSGEAIANYTCAADVVYYGFDPANPNARFSAPNKLYEALASGRPLITGDFGEIAEVVRAAACGVVLSAYEPQEIRRTLELLSDRERREAMAANALRCGRTGMDWSRAEETLRREYSALLKTGLAAPIYDRDGQDAL